MQSSREGVRIVENMGYWHGPLMNHPYHKLFGLLVHSDR